MRYALLALLLMTTAAFADDVPPAPGLAADAVVQYLANRLSAANAEIIRLSAELQKAKTPPSAIHDTEPPEGLNPPK
jgi:hypothetical protein